MKGGRHQGSFTEGHVHAKRPNSFFGRLVAGPQNDFNVGVVWWLEGQPLNSSANMFVDVMGMATGRRLSDTIVVSCVCLTETHSSIVCIGVKSGQHLRACALKVFW